MKDKIIFKNISKSYGDKIILKNINLKIEEGEFITILGPSGCGKTTLLKLVNRLLNFDEGSILIDGKDILKSNPVNLRRNIGYAIQGSILFPHMTVEENISYVPSLLNGNDKKRTKMAVYKWLKIVGLNKSLLEHYPDEISGGQQQRVGIARALAASPDILLMDEPFSAVDEITRKNLQNEIIRIQRETGITILFVTHDVEEAIRLGTKVLILNEGTIEQFDVPEKILKNPASEFIKKLIKYHK
ncbi:ABC transporter ATP-binding protein [Fusobacterium sp.]|uniref:ABC transporter ATP-binding protein n=1 Tax=Fusobacterium sp. TaxID=68766 RepID=UPI0028FF7DB5|nr:ABC transporter ATP-binding protein [Fusobacterium sp.]MDU1910099.1 ABC transporter ATP-binding protein [Fusobacterium sp.]